MASIALFYFAVTTLAYSYLLYPVLIWFVGRRFRAHRGTPDPDHQFEWPFLSVLLAAHNEQDVIGDRVRNFFDCVYPGKSEIVIVSDGSSDCTAEIAAQFTSDRVIVIETAQRAGKGAAINLAAQAGHGEILVFTDANSFFEQNALAELAKRFADREVGLVTGCTQYPAKTIGSAYQRYEQMLKRFESQSGVVATADGAIYAMRRSLWRAHDPALINDFLHPILVALEGKRALIEPHAICREQFSIDSEFRRQVRMVSQAAYIYVRFFLPLVRERRWCSVLVLTSHKLLRWLTAPLLALAVVTTVLAAPAGGIYRTALVAEAMFALLAVLGAIAARLGLDQRAEFVWQFIVLNCACAMGLWRGLIGNIPVMWRPREL